MCHRWVIIAILLMCVEATWGQSAKSVQAILAEEGDRFPGGLVPGHVPASADEPFATSFSLRNAARSLDLTALNWQSQPRQQCSQCHANMLYLCARPALTGVVKEPPAVADLFKHIVESRWENHGLLYAVESVAIGVPLALHDRQTSGRLQPITRKALDHMASAQQADGTWGDTAGGKYAFFRRYEQTLFAAIGIAQAPDEYAASEIGQRVLDRIRQYATMNPPETAYAKGMLLWASAHAEGLADDDDRKSAAEELLALQRTDGGWALRRLLADDPRQPAGKHAVDLPSDGYGTGFVLFALRKSGISASDPRLQNGVAWLKSHQRESGRWFHPTLSDRPNHVLSNTATAWAVMALEACGEIQGEH